MAEYYAFLSSITNLVGEPLRALDARISIPIITALLLGLIGSTSPCQLTTNITALAYVSRWTGDSRRVFASALSYLLGKIVVYSLLGGVAIVAGIQLSSALVPVVVIVRKALGPVLILLGLFMLGVLRLNVSVGQGLSIRLEQKASKDGRWSPFLLGMAFSFAFCPTLFWLFFGLLMPLSVSARGGLIFPSIFALGTTLPLLALSLLLALGIQNVGKYIHQMKRFDRYIRLAVGIVFIMAGINEVIVYWLT